MKIPQGHTEDEVLALIKRISKKLAYTFIFPPYTYEDVVQEGIILGIEGLEGYSEDYPLENFLWVHMRRRFCTFKRNNYMRLTKPCLTCPFQAYLKKSDICTKYHEKSDCELYSEWEGVVEKKKNLNSPISMEHEHYKEADPATELSHKEMIKLIDEKISISSRPLWLQVKGGIKLSKSQMTQVRGEIEKILETNNINVGDYF